MKIQNKYLSLLAIGLASITPTVFAAITITPSITPGEFNHAIRLELAADDPAAKIFYSFNPDGGPNDALAYTGPILLKSSTSFVYFGFVSLDNESKVLIDDYIFNYPNLSFTGEYTRENNLIKGAKLTNTSEKDIDLSYWQVHAQDYTYEIPENTILKPTESYTLPDIPTLGGQAVLLMSPDGENKDILAFQDAMSTPLPVVEKPVKKTFSRSTVRELAPEIWIKPKIKQIEQPKVAETVTTPTEDTPTETKILTPVATEKVDTKSADNQAENIAPSTDTKLSDNLKISVSENTNTSKNATWYILGLVVLSGVTIAMRLFLKKK